MVDQILSLRGSLLRRLENTFDFLVIQAPPGSGRGHLLRELAAPCRDAIIINCSQQEQRCHLLQQQLALSGRKDHETPEFVAFHQIDHLLALPGGIDALSAAIDGAGKAKRLAITSWEAPPLSLARLHGRRITYLNQDDLLLDRADIVEIFRGNGHEAVPEDILAVTHGWYAAVMACRNMIDDGVRPIALSNPLLPQMTELRRFIFRELIAPLAANALHALLISVAVPDLSREEARKAGISQDWTKGNTVWKAMLKGVPRQLLLATLTEQFGPTIASIRRRVAIVRSEGGQPLRALQLYVRLGELDDIDTLLDCGLNEPSGIDFAALASLISEIRAELLAEERLWNVAMAYCEVLIPRRLEISALLEDKSSIQGVKRVRIAVLAAFCHIAAGEANIADRLLNMLAEEGAFRIVDDATTLRVRAVVDAYLGKTRTARARWHDSMLLGGSFAVPCLGRWLLDLRINQQLYDGRWHSACKLMWRKVEAAALKQCPHVQAQVLVDIVSHAIIGGLTADAERALNELGSLCQAHDLSAFGEIYRAIAQLGRRYARCWLSAVRCVLYAESDQEAQRWAAELVEMLPQIQTPIPAIAARLLITDVLPQHRERLLLEAENIALATESLELQQAIQKWRRGNVELGMFHSIGRRAGLVASCENVQFRLAVYRCELLRNGSPVPIAARGFEILVALALRGKLLRDDLAELIWPNLQPPAAANALKQALHRLRIWADSKEIVRFDNGRYELSPDVAVDFREIDAVLSSLPREALLPPILRSRLESLADEVTGKSIAPIARWEWASADTMYLESLRRRALMLLARDSFERHDAASVERFIRNLLLLDQCDEEAHELAMRQVLRSGGRAAAEQQYERYLGMLNHDLDIQEESKLASLLKMPS